MTLTEIISRRMAVALLAALICGPAIAQQSGSSSGAAANGAQPAPPSAPPPGTTPKTEAAPVFGSTKITTPSSVSIGGATTPPPQPAPITGAGGAGAKHAPPGGISVGAPTIPQQPGIITKTRAGATANSVKALPPSAFSIGGRMMLKPGQDFVGGGATPGATTGSGRR